MSYMHHEAQIVLPEILRKARIKVPVPLGHSNGASISIIYAGTFPDSLAGLILEAPHVFVEDISVANIAEAREAYRQTDLVRVGAVVQISESRPGHFASICRHRFAVCQIDSG